MSQPPKITIGKDWRGFKVSAQRFDGGHGQTYVVHSLKSQLAADLVADALTVKEALGVERPLESLHLLQRRSDQVPIAPDAAVRAALAEVDYPEAVRQVQASVLQRAGAGQQAAHTATDMAAALVILASAGGHTAAVALLLSLHPEAARAQNQYGWFPLRCAASGCHVRTMRLLMAAAPDAVLISDGQGQLPLHKAAFAHAEEGRKVGALQLLLAAAPQSVAATDSSSNCPLHLAAYATRFTRSDAAVQLLLGAAPAIAAQTNSDGSLPLHCAAAGGHVPTIELLLAAAPTAASSRCMKGWTPLACAANAGHLAAVQVLLAAAPEAANTSTFGGKLPIELAVGAGASWRSNAHQDTARFLATAGATAFVLTGLRCCPPERGWPLVAEAIRPGLPLSEVEWALVPCGCIGLGAALPAALAHSPEQAWQLVRCLPRSDLFKLRTLARCLARVQRRMRTALPSPVVERLLCLAVS